MNAASIALGAITDMGHMAVWCGWLTAAAAVTMPGDTWAASRLAAGTWKDGRGYLPRWLAGVLSACLAIPGPLDEMAALVAVAGVMAVDGRARRGIVTALYGAVYTESKEV